MGAGIHTKDGKVGGKKIIMCVLWDKAYMWEGFVLLSCLIEINKIDKQLYMNSLKTMKFEDFNDVNNYRLRTNDNTPWLLFFLK